MNKELLKGALVVLIVSALFVAHRYTVNHAAKKAYHEGSINERATWLARDSKERHERNLKIIELETKYRALEEKSANDVAAASATYQKELARVHAEKSAALADAKRYRLRWTTSCTGGQGSGGDSTATPGTTAGGAVGTATCELPEPVRRGLLELAGRANQVVAERNALLEIAKKDREVCK